MPGAKGAPIITTIARTNFGGAVREHFKFAPDYWTHSHRAVVVVWLGYVKLCLHDTQTLKTQKIEEYLAKNTDEYQVFLRKYGTHTMKPACDLVGCKPEGAFLPNSAGWTIYKRVQ